MSSRLFPYIALFLCSCAGGALPVVAQDPVVIPFFDEKSESPLPETPVVEVDPSDDLYACEVSERYLGVVSSVEIANTTFDCLQKPECAEELKSSCEVVPKGKLFYRGVTTDRFAFFQTERCDTARYEFLSLDPSHELWVVMDSPMDFKESYMVNYVGEFYEGTQSPCVVALSSIGIEMSILVRNY